MFEQEEPPLGGSRWEEDYNALMATLHAKDAPSSFETPTPVRMQPRALHSVLERHQQFWRWRVPNADLCGFPASGEEPLRVCVSASWMIEQQKLAETS